MKYVVVSAVVTDEIHFPDGNVKIAPGGAGFYALCGLRLWSDQVVAVTGIVKNSRVQMMLFWIALKKILSWKSSIKFFSPIKLMFGDNPFQSVKEYANVITPGSNIILTLISSAGAIRK